MTEALDMMLNPAKIPQYLTYLQMAEKEIRSVHHQNMNLLTILIPFLTYFINIGKLMKRLIYRRVIKLFLSYSGTLSCHAMTS